MNISNLPKLSDFVDLKGRIIPYNDDPGPKKYFLQLRNINGKTDWTKKVNSYMVYDLKEAVISWLKSDYEFNITHLETLYSDDYDYSIYESKKQRLDDDISELYTREWLMIEHLQKCDKLIDIQRVWRGYRVRQLISNPFMLEYLYDSGGLKKRHSKNAITIQRIWRGIQGRMRWTEWYAWDWWEKDKASEKIQANWRRFSKRNELSCLRAMREIDLRICRARYKAVIDASEKIHRAWSALKIRRNLSNLYRDQRRKNFIKTHGLYDLFIEAVDMAMENGNNDKYVYLDVGKYMQFIEFNKGEDKWIIT